MRDSASVSLSRQGILQPMTPWYLLKSGLGAPAMNMAMDEALLEFASRIGGPVLRFYGWTEPAATFGYSQRYAELARWTRLRPLIRRPTGGGLVPHDADWTYSLVFPPDDPWYALKAVESYRRVHEWICAAFQSIGLAMELAPCARPASPGQCFAGAERFDVLWQGRKIAGAAQRRNKSGLLIQGSVQARGLPATRSQWEGAMQRSVPGIEEVGWNDFGMALPAPTLQEVESRAEALAREKYAQANYNQRR